MGTKRAVGGARRMMMAYAEANVCRTCKAAPGQVWGRHKMGECGPCAVKRIDREEAMTAMEGA